MSTDQENPHPFAVPDSDQEIFEILAMTEKIAPESLALARGIIDGKLVSMIVLAVDMQLNPLDTSSDGKDLPADGINLIPLAIIYDVDKYDEDGDDMLPSKLLTYADQPEMAQQIVDGLGGS